MAQVDDTVRRSPWLGDAMLLRRLLGLVLRRIRLRQGRTLREVAEAAGVSVPYLSEIERGLKEASSEILAAVCRALRLRLSDLLEEVRLELLRLEPAVPGSPGVPAAPVAPLAPGPSAAPTRADAWRRRDAVAGSGRGCTASAPAAAWRSDAADGLIRPPHRAPGRRALPSRLNRPRRLDRHSGARRHRAPHPVRPGLRGWLVDRRCGPVSRPSWPGARPSGS
jgi:transcriptional regulator with XRE-family HTH domain